MAEEKKEHRKHAGHGYRHTHIEHHDDGSHTVEHHHEDGASHKKYAVGHLDDVQDGLKDHLGVPPSPGAEAGAGMPVAAGPAAGAPPPAVA